MRPNEKGKYTRIDALHEDLCIAESHYILTVVSANIEFSTLHITYINPRFTTFLEYYISYRTLGTTLVTVH